MFLRAILTLTLGAVLTGCFFTLDGSLVDRKPDARRSDAGLETSSGKDAKHELRPTEARSVDLPGASDAITPKAEKPPAGG